MDRVVNAPSSLHLVTIAGSISMQPPIVGWLLLFLSVNVGFARGKPLDCKNVQWVGGQPFDLSPVFANGPLNLTVEEETPPSTTITTVLMNLCEPLALDPSIDPSDQCPENTHVCKIVKSRRGTSERVEQVIPTAISAAGSRQADVSYTSASYGKPTLELRIKLGQYYTVHACLRLMLDQDGIAWSFEP